MRVPLTFLLLITLTHCFGQHLKSIDKRLTALYKNVPDSFTEDQKEARMERFERLLMKYAIRSPETISYPFKNLISTGGVFISTSDDGNFRIYSYDRNRVRSMPWFNNIYQFRVNGKVLAKHVLPPRALIPDYTIYKINDLVANKKTYYIAQRVAFGELTTGYSIRFLSIENGRVNDNVKLVQTEKGLTNVLGCGAVDELNENAKFTITYNKSAGTISMPELLPNGKIGKKLITYKFNGKYFVKS